MHCNVRRKWMVGASLCAISFVSNFGLESAAKAESICGYDGASFSCDNGAAPAPSAYGTYSSEHAGLESWGTLNFVSSGAIDVELAGGEVIGVAGNNAVSLFTWGGDVSFTSSGRITNTAGYGLFLYGKNVDAFSGDVALSDAIGGTSAVRALAYAGNVSLTGGTTITDDGYGVTAEAYGGNSVTYSGTITSGAWGLRSYTFSLGDSCGTNTVNVTGNITASSQGALLLGCGESKIVVEADRTVEVSNEDGIAISNYAPEGHSSTIIAGSVRNTSILGRALTSLGVTTETEILSGGTLFGRYNNYNAQENLFQIRSGGTWVTSGTNAFWYGQDTLSNEGRIVAVGTTDFTGLEVFANSGTVDMQNGSADDVLSIDGDYVGSGSAALLVDARAGQVDRFQIAGNASGTTTIIVDSDGLVDPEGLAIVQAGSMDPGAFVIQNNEATRLISYSLVADDNELKVVALPNAAAYQPLLLPNFATNLWFESAEAIWSHSNFGGGQLRDQAIGFWMQPFVGGGSFSASKFQGAFGGGQTIRNGRANLDNKGLQVGANFSPVPGLAQLGAAFGYTRATLGQKGLDGEIRASTLSAALYAQAGAATGPYGLVMVKQDWNRANMTGDAFSSASNDPDGKSFGLAAEAGVRWTSRAFNLETGVRISRVVTTTDGFQAEGIDYAFKDSSAVRLEFSAGVKSAGRTAYYARGKLIHEFGDAGAMTLTSGDAADSVDAASRGTWARLEAGVHFTGAGNIVAGLWTDVGSTQSLGVRAGVSF